MRGRVALVFFAIAIVLAIVELAFWRRGGDPRRAPDAGASRSSSDAPAGSSSPPAAPANVRRLDGAIERARVQQAIAAARARREAAAPDAAEPREPTVADVSHAIAELTPLLEQCLDEAKPRLRVASGKVRFAMMLSGEPDVGTLIEDATLSGDDALPGDEELARCLHETLMSVELPPMPVGGTAFYSTTLLLTP